MKESPVSQAILAKTTVFTSYSKRNNFGQNTQLWVGFANIKSFHSQNTQFWAAFVKIWRHWEQNRKFTSAFLKGSVTIFNVTVKRQKTESYQWKPKNKGSTFV